MYNNIGRCNKIVNLHWEQMLSDTQEEGDWFNMNGNASAVCRPAGHAHRQPARRLHGMEAKNTLSDRRRHDGLSAPEFNGYLIRLRCAGEFGLDPEKQLHLYISSFGYASMSEEGGSRAFQNAGTDFTGFAKNKPHLNAGNTALVR